jgi:hypothetical protein
MRGASKGFDEQLFKLKASQLSHEMQIEHEALGKNARSEAQKAGGSVLRYIADRELVHLRERMEAIDRICREVWQSQGETVTPEFVRDILAPKVMGQIGLVEVLAKSRATDGHHREPTWTHVAREVGKLKSEIANR